MTSVLIWTGGFNLDKQLPGIYQRYCGWGHDDPAKVILEVESESAKIGFLGMAYCEVILVAIAILTWGICFLNTVHFLCCDQHHTMNCIPQDRGIQPPQLLMAFGEKVEACLQISSSNLPTFDEFSHRPFIENLPQPDLSSCQAWGVSPIQRKSRNVRKDGDLLFRKKEVHWKF